MLQRQQQQRPDLPGQRRLWRASGYTLHSQLASTTGQRGYTGRASMAGAACQGAQGGQLAATARAHLDVNLLRHRPHFSKALRLRAGGCQDLDAVNGDGQGDEWQVGRQVRGGQCKLACGTAAPEGQ